MYLCIGTHLSPSRLKDDILMEKQFFKFVKVLNELNIKTPLTEVSNQMPIYAKFFKDVTSNRHKLKEVQIVYITNLPKKLDDPSKFSIPCVIGEMKIDNALCELGASVSCWHQNCCQF